MCSGNVPCRPVVERRNSSGERLYLDSAGAKCNIRGMIQREPGWVATRFDLMEDQLAAREKELAGAKARIKELEADNARLRAALPDPRKLRTLADWLDAYDAIHGAVNDGVQTDLRAWAEAAEAAKESKPNA